MPRMKNPSDDMSSRNRTRSRNRGGDDGPKSGMSRPARPSASPMTKPARSSVPPRPGMSQLASKNAGAAPKALSAEAAANNASRAAAATANSAAIKARAQAADAARSPAERARLTIDKSSTAGGSKIMYSPQPGGGASPRTTGPMDMPARPPAPKPMGSSMSMAKGPSTSPMGMSPRPMAPGPQGAMKKPGYKKGGYVGCKTY